MSLTGGRPRKPVALKVLQGKARKDRVNAQAPTPKVVAKVPPPPKDLDLEETAAWRTLAKIVEPLKVATPADIVAFRQMAISLAMIDKARDALRKDGGELTFTVHTDNGPVLRKRPEVDIIANFKRVLAVDLSRFGLTPADRERVSALGEEGKGDGLDEFTVGGNGAA